MSWILNDIKSLLPSNAPTPSKVPALGEQAPLSNLKLDASKSVIVFLRHLGCPFCEQQVRQAIQIAAHQPDVHYHLITHAEQHQIDDYVKTTNLPSVPSNVRLVADPSRLIYAAYGVGEIGFTSVFGLGGLKKVGELRKEGIKNTLTIGSRWQNSGAFAVDNAHVVRWLHISEEAADVPDLSVATRSLQSL